MTYGGNEILLIPSRLFRPLLSIILHPQNDLHRHHLFPRSPRCHLEGIQTLRWHPWNELICQYLSQIKSVAVLAGVTFDTPTNYVHFETNKTPEFTSKFPHGKVPALETPEGFLLIESTAIIRYS